MIRKKHNITNSCPMCGVPIVGDIAKHRCESSDKPAKPDYSWIKVKRYVDDESLTWEERYKRLMQHHIEETTFLIDEVNKLRK